MEGEQYDTILHEAIAAQLKMDKEREYMRFRFWLRRWWRPMLTEPPIHFVAYLREDDTWEKEPMDILFWHRNLRWWKLRLRKD